MTWSIMGTWPPICGSRTLFPQQANNRLPHRRRNKQFRWERRRVGQAFELGGGPVYGQYHIHLDPETGRIIGFSSFPSVSIAARPNPSELAFHLSASSPPVWSCPRSTGRPPPT